MNKNCSLWIMVARTDVSFMMQTIPHIIRMNSYPFSDRILAVDTRELSGEKSYRPDIGSLGALRDCCNDLQGAGIVNKVIDIDYSTGYRRKVYKRHFKAGNLIPTHNYKGYPVLGSIFCLEECKDDFMVHFDSDMLIYQERGFDWVGFGIRLMEENPGILWVRPAVGPQPEYNNYYARNSAPRDSRGFYPIHGFSSRCYLLNKRLFESLLPMNIIWAKKQGRILDKYPRIFVESVCSLTGRGLLDSWEKMVGRGMSRTGLIGAHIADKVWTLHPKDRGKVFLSSLAGIIDNIEHGRYPDKQAGYADLLLEHWK